MARLEPKVRITVLHTEQGAPQFPGIGNVDEVHVPPRPGRRQYMLECLDLSDRFADRLLEVPQAIVYSQGICVVRRAGLLSDRLIFNPHGLEAFQVMTLRDQIPAIPMRAIHRHVFKHARLVISLGGRLTDILSGECRNPESRVAVLPNGVIVPPSRPRATRSSGDSLRLLFVGRLARNKGVPDLLAAMDEIARRGAAGRFELDIVGGGPLLDSLTRTNARPNVRFLGKVADDALEALYSAADVLVLPTLFEGMPTVVLEAMARSLPVLVTDVGATRELVDSTNGEIIPKRDPGALADALLRLDAAGTKARQLLGQRGLAKVNERFTWEQVARDHLELFRRVDQQRTARD